MKKIYVFQIFCVALMISGVFCTFGVIDIASKTSGAYGHAVSYHPVDSYTEFDKFDFGLIEFETKDYFTYTNVHTQGSKSFNGNKKQYGLYFNNMPLSNVEQSAGKISGEWTEKFYQTDGNVRTTATVHFLIEYTAEQTRVTITTRNNNDSISYLYAYMNINGAVLKVVEVGDKA